MSANNVRRDLAERTRRLEQDVGNLLRRRTANALNLRDVDDVRATGVAAGQVLVYDTARGLWVPQPIPVFFSQGGPVTTGLSDRWDCPFPTARFTRAFGSLTVVADTDTDVDLLHDGSVFDTFTIAAGDLTGGVDIDELFTGPEDGYGQVEVTTAGSGGEGLTVVWR